MQIEGAMLRCVVDDVEALGCSARTRDFDADATFRLDPKEMDILMDLKHFEHRNAILSCCCQRTYIGILGNG